MMHKKMKWLLVLIVGIVITGCGVTKDAEVTEFNKPALYWYKHIAKSISNNNLDKADSYYISLKSEHMHSPLLKTAILMLAHAHMLHEEYLLANYYFDEYLKRFGDEKNMDYIAFMKLKASFLGIKDVYKDQKLIMDSITEAKTFLVRYPSSEYTPMVNTILIRLLMSQYLLNENIAALYDRIGKHKAAKIYRNKNSNSILEMSDIKPPKKGIIGNIFD